MCIDAYIVTRIINIRIVVRNVICNGIYSLHLNLRENLTKILAKSKKERATIRHRRRRRRRRYARVGGTLDYRIRSEQ